MKTTVKNEEPFLNNLFELEFPIENETLSSRVVRMSSSHIVFEINIDENNRLVPLKEVIALGKQEGDLSVKMYDKKGNVFLTVKYFKCRFYPQIDELFYHDYESTDLKQLTVIFEYSWKKVIDEKGVTIISDTEVLESDTI